MISALVCVLVVAGPAGTASAQRALKVTKLRSGVPNAVLTLRPEPGLRQLAVDVAAVLELRTGQRVEVGEPPPPGLPEAVPAGNVAMARDGRSVVLVIGAPGGRSFDARVELEANPSAPGQSGQSDARAVALAAETLRDTATELARKDDVELQLDSEPILGFDSERAPLVEQRQRRAMVDEGASEPHAESSGPFGDIGSLFYVRAYSGASTASAAPTAGLGSGFGLCVENNCLFVAGELPLTPGSTGAGDLRYRYLTFVSGFYARPVSFGAFTPGATIGFLSRLGHFEADMGLPDEGIDTDLGARGSLELAWEVALGLDVMAEGGVDFTIDRHHMATGSDLVARGDRWSPWAQAALRYRP